MRNGPYELVVAPADYPGKRYRGRYVYEHHLVWWQHTGEVVPEGHVVHHKNEHKRDNRFDNFELQAKPLHDAAHGRLRRGPTRHGTMNAYSNHRCRCDLCRTANTRRLNEWRWRTGRRRKRDIGRSTNGC